MAKENDFNNEIMAMPLQPLQMLQTMPEGERMKFVTEFKFKLPDLFDQGFGPCQYPCNLLDFACVNGDVPLARTLLDEPQVAEKMMRGDQPQYGGPLHLACWAGNDDMVSYLLSREDGRALMNSPVTSYAGELPLQCAVDAGSLECVRLLIEAGADIGKRDATGNSDNVLTSALKKDRMNIARYLVDKFGADDPKLNPLDNADHFRALNQVCLLDTTRLRFICNELKFPPASKRGGWTLIMQKIYRNLDDSVAVIEWLRTAIDLGVDPAEKNPSGNTPAEKALEFGSEKVAEFLKAA